MTRRFRRVSLIILTFASALLWALLVWPQTDPLELRVGHLTPTPDSFRHELLEVYGRVHELLAADNPRALAALAPELAGHLGYLVALTLASSTELSARERLAFYEQVLAQRIEDPLERAAIRALHASVGAVAEEAGEFERARRAYREALPLPAAIAGLERLPLNPFERAAAFSAGNLPARALEALGGLAAPSLEAPAYRALGQHSQALTAYQNWLDAEPGHPGALEGVAWSLFHLERWQEADAAFARIGGVTAAYGRGLVAGREGRIDDGVAWLLATGQPARMWIAAGWLDTRGRSAEAIDAYLRIAATGDATFADDAAYRALVLADRRNDAEAAALAARAIPAGSFFDLRRGGTVVIPAVTAVAVPVSLSDAAMRAFDLATALVAVGEQPAAIGELLFALRDARAQNLFEESVALAGWLQANGEFRHSTRAAALLLTEYPDDWRLWWLSYPQAFREPVVAAAVAYGVDAAWVWAVMKQESAFAPLAVSTSNAMGLMQVIPSTWDWLAGLLHESPGDPFDVVDNIRYGSYYLSWLARYFDGDLELATASYNRGQGYIGRLFASPEIAGDHDELYRFIDALETREYLQRVGVNVAIYRALYP